MDDATQLVERHKAWEKVEERMAAYAEGFKAGQEAMRERAAAATDNVTRYDGPFTDFGDHAEDGYGNAKTDAIAAIRALPIEEPQQ